MIIANMACSTSCALCHLISNACGIIVNIFICLLSINTYQDATSGAQVKVYKGHNSYVTCCHTDPDSARCDREFVNSE